jgi:hypothetical protein
MEVKAKRTIKVYLLLSLLFHCTYLLTDDAEQQFNLVGDK